MPAKAVQRPKVRQQLVTGTVVDAQDAPTVSRLLGELADAHQNLDARQQPRDQQVVNLAIGVNVVNHGLGRRARGCNVTPTVADATWAYALTASDDKTVTITTVGVAQPKAPLEIW